MPKCPDVGCEIKWVWDNHMVNFREERTGAFCKEKVIFNEQTEEKDGIIVVMFQCLCGIILGFSANDPKFGGPVFNHCDWDKVDWNDKENTWNSSS